MSRLDELIAELCPNGVEYKSLKEIASILRGKRLTKGELSPDALYPVYHGGLEPLGYYLKSNRPANTVMVINVGASAGTVGFCDKRFWSSDGCYCISHVDTINQKFLYYVLSMKEKFLMSKVRYAGIPTLDAKVVENVIIPVPPLPVQEEIVRILDTFSELTAELTAELTKRKQQYQYYRNNIIDFSENRADKSKRLEELITDLCPNGVEYKELGEVTCLIKNGFTYEVDKTTTKKYKVSRIETISGGVINMGKVATVNVADEKYRLADGDILFSHINSLPYLGNIAFYEEKYGELYHGMNLLCFRFVKDVVLPKFAFYIFRTSFFRKYIDKYAKHSCNQYSLSISTIKKWKIPTPPLPVQKEIVTILDRFDALCNDLTSGLPAEIEARKKQYEYYRDKLLTFKEAV